MSSARLECNFYNIFLLLLLLPPPQTPMSVQHDKIKKIKRNAGGNKKNRRKKKKGSIKGLEEKRPRVYYRRRLSTRTRTHETPPKVCEAPPFFFLLPTAFAACRNCHRGMNRFPPSLASLEHVVIPPPPPSNGS